MAGKRLILLRHAKSDWYADYSSDHDRPLAGRGIRTAKMVGRMLCAAKQVPQLVVCSSATRAVDTLERASRSGKWECDIEVTDKLYEVGPEDVLKLIRKLPDEVDGVMLVGHEPTFSETARLLTGARARMSTGSMARIDCPVDSWEELEKGFNELVWLFQPKFFTKGGWIEDALKPPKTLMD